MVDIEYSNAFCEVLKILEYVDIDDYKKIPPGLIQTFYTYANWNWNFKYDVNKTLDEQHVSKVSKAIIAKLFKEYWATPYQKERIKAKEDYDIKQRELRLQEKYNPDNLFKTRNLNIAKKNTEDTNHNTAMVEIKEKNFLQKILDRIKKLFIK